MKSRLPAIVTILLIAGGLVYLAQRERWSGWKSSAEPDATPERTIWQMSDASRRGDVKGYLDCFSGVLRQNLEKTVADLGEGEFSEYLKRLEAALTGIALSDLEQTSDDQATLRVEFVFRGRTESQRNQLKRTDGRWKVVRVDDAESVKSLIPYGTAVGEKE